MHYITNRNKPQPGASLGLLCIPPHPDPGGPAHRGYLLNNLHPVAELKLTVRRKRLGFLPSWKGPKSKAFGLPSVPTRAPPAARPGIASPRLRHRPPPSASSAPRPHSLFLRKRSSCSTAMALTQSRAACSNEYNVKAIAARSLPRPNRSFSRRRRRRGAATAGALLREPGRPQTRSPGSSAPIRLEPAPRSRQRGGSAVLSRPVRSRLWSRLWPATCGCSKPEKWLVAVGVL